MPVRVEKWSPGPQLTAAVREEAREILRPVWEAKGFDAWLATTEHRVSAAIAETKRTQDLRRRGLAALSRLRPVAEYAIAEEREWRNVINPETELPEIIPLEDYMVEPMLERVLEGDWLPKAASFREPRGFVVVEFHNKCVSLQEDERRLAAMCLLLFGIQRTKGPASLSVADVLDLEVRAVRKIYERVVQQPTWRSTFLSADGAIEGIRIDTRPRGPRRR